MLNAIFPGSFDPITFGHMDIIERAALFVDRLTVLVMENSEKSPIFSPEERITQLERLTAGYSNIVVTAGKGLTADCAKRLNAKIIIRAIRNFRDYDYEMQIAEVNKKLTNGTNEHGIETVFLSARPEYAYLSSTIVKEFMKHNASIDLMVPDCIKNELAEKMKIKE